MGWSGELRRARGDALELPGNREIIPFLASSLNGIMAEMGVCLYFAEKHRPCLSIRFYECYVLGRMRRHVLDDKGIHAIGDGAPYPTHEPNRYYVAHKILETAVTSAESRIIISGTS